MDVGKTDGLHHTEQHSFLQVELMAAQLKRDADTIASLRSAIASMQTQHEVEVKTLKRTVENLRAQLASCQCTITDEVEVKTLKRTVENLRSQLASCQCTITDEVEVKTLKRTVENLRSQLASCRCTITPDGQHHDSAGKDTSNTAGKDAENAAKLATSGICEMDCDIHGVKLESDSVPIVYSGTDCDINHDVKLEPSSSQCAKAIRLTSATIGLRAAERGRMAADAVQLAVCSLESIQDDMDCDVDDELESNSVRSVYSDVECGHVGDIDNGTASPAGMESDSQECASLIQQQPCTTPQYTGLKRSDLRKPGEMLCELCGVCFHSARQLQQHMSTHSGRKPGAATSGRKSRECWKPRQSMQPFVLLRNECFGPASQLKQHVSSSTGQKTPTGGQCSKAQRIMQPFVLLCDVRFQSPHQLMRGLSAHTGQTTTTPVSNCMDEKTARQNTSFDIVDNTALDTVGQQTVWWNTSFDDGDEQIPASNTVLGIVEEQTAERKIFDTVDLQALGRDTALDTAGKEQARQNISPVDSMDKQTTGKQTAEQGRMAADSADKQTVGQDTIPISASLQADVDCSGPVHGCAQAQCSQILPKGSVDSTDEQRASEETSARPLVCKFCRESFQQSELLFSHVCKKRFKCAHCAARFGSHKTLQEHASSHRGKGRECADCDRRFTRTSHWKKHVCKKSHWCTGCDVKFDNAYVLERHMGRQMPCKSYVCADSCGESFKLACELRKHMYSVHGKSKYKSVCIFTCGVCSASFSRAGNLQNHMLKHSGKKAYKCSQCGSAFTTRYYLKDHMRIHTGKKPYLCTLCGASFLWQISFKLHMARKHSGERRFVCEHCGEGFCTGKALTSHVFTHTGIKTFKCKQCDATYRGHSGLRAHMMRHSGKCDVCGATFPTSSELKVHKRVHRVGVHTVRKQFQCPDCGGIYSSKPSLSRHMTIHSANKPYKCQQCSASFRIDLMLKKHMLIHSGLKPFKCTECGADFTQANHLTKHKSVHTDAHPHKCSHCTASFKRAINLKQHMAIHTGQKPHKCAECGASFTQASSLASHMVLHSAKMPYKCEHCDASFKWPVNLKTHMKSHTDQ